MEEAFYTAEEYHQAYAKKNPVGYAAYRTGSGREDFVANVCQIREEKKRHLESLERVKTGLALLGLP